METRSLKCKIIQKMVNDLKNFKSFDEIFDDLYLYRKKQKRLEREKKLKRIFKDDRQSIKNT